MNISKEPNADMDQLTKEEMKHVVGGNEYNGQELHCPLCGAEKLYGKEDQKSDGSWVVLWYCGNCHRFVIETPM